MARAVNRAEGDRRSTPSVVPGETKLKKKPEPGVFRSPHRKLEVVVERSERIDHGGGTYEIKAPVTVLFEDFGSYGEARCDADMAEKLRAYAKERADRQLPPKFVEI